ncbi:MAG: hypothetical protein ACK4KT_01595, partial [Thermaurantimonas sp.]
MKNILVTGISRGLGFVLTKLILEKGWTVYGISRIKTEQLSDLEKNYPHTLKWSSYDLSDCENIRLK